MFVTRNKIFMTSKNKNIMTSSILEEMEKRGRRQVVSGTYDQTDWSD